MSPCASTQSRPIGSSLVRLAQSAVARDRAGAQTVIAAEHDRHRAFFERAQRGLIQLLTDLRDLAHVLLALVARRLRLRNRRGEIAFVGDGVAQRREPLAETGDAKRRRPHVHAAPAAAEVQGNADEVKSLHRLVASSAAAAAAVFRASAMQSGMPTPRKPLPVMKTPTCCSSARSMCGHAREVTDVVLRVRALPSVDAREQRFAANAEQRRERLHRQRNQLLVRPVERVRIAGAADEGSQQRAVGGRAVRPLRRQPRGGEHAGVFDARHHESGSVQWMVDGFAPKRKRDRGR